MTDKNLKKGNRTNLSPLARAHEGEPQTCDTCGTTYPLIMKHWSPKNANPNGWQTTCRKCIGRKRNSRPIAADMEDDDPRHPDTGGIGGFQAHPVNNFEKFVEQVTAAVDELTELMRSPKMNTRRIKVLQSRIKRATRLKGDPAGEGQQKVPLIAFWTFVRAVLRPTMGDGWYEPGPIHDDIVAGLMTDKRETLILASRNSAKSTFTTFFATWLLWRDPMESILVISRSESLSRKLLRSVRMMIEASPALHELLPKDDSLDNVNQFDIGPATGKMGMTNSFTCRGITGQITGLRARTIILDDIEKSSDDSPEIVEKLEEAISEIWHVLNPGPKSKIICLGTPQSDFSLYGRMMESGTWEVHRACLFEEDVIDGKIVYESRWPDRFPSEEFEKRRKGMVERQWRLHWKIDLSAAATKERPLKLTELPVIDLPAFSATAPLVIARDQENPRILRGLPKGRAGSDEDWTEAHPATNETRPWIQTVAAIDPAGGLKGRGDAIGLSVVSVTAGGHAVIRAARGVRQETTQKALKEVCELLRRFRPTQVVVEEGAQEMFTSQLRASLAATGYPCKVDRVTTGNVKKGKRIIECLAPAFASGKVSVCMEALQGDDGIEFVNQLTGIDYDGRKLKHDDIIDAVSYAVAQIKDVLSSEEASFVSSARYSYEELSRLPLRSCAIQGEDLELWCEQDEQTDYWRERLNHFLAVHSDELSRGFDDPSIRNAIQHAQRELAKVDRREGHFEYTVDPRTFMRIE